MTASLPRDLQGIMPAKCFISPIGRFVLAWFLKSAVSVSVDTKIPQSLLDFEVWHENRPILLESLHFTKSSKPSYLSMRFYHTSGSGLVAT